MLGFGVLVDMDQPQLTKVVYDVYKIMIMIMIMLYYMMQPRVWKILTYKRGRPKKGVEDRVEDEDKENTLLMIPNKVTPVML